MLLTFLVIEGSDSRGTTCIRCQWGAKDGLADRGVVEVMSVEWESRSTIAACPPCLLER